MKKILFFLLLLVSIVVLAYQFKPVKSHVDATVNVLIAEENLIDKDSLTIKTRVNLPEGFKRVEYPKGSFEDYLRNYKLKAFGSKIIKCADALIRIRSEYLWDNNRKNEIGFNFTSGHYCSWKKYAEGYRPKVKGNKVTFHKTASANHSKENFYKYLNLIYIYSGTLSLYNELESITKVEDLKLGDMLILGGTPGHIVMLADEVTNEKDEKLFLLFQGNTPAFYDSKFVRFK